MAVHPHEPRPNQPATNTSSGECPLAAAPRGLTPAAFADLLEASSATLWTIAAAILGDGSEAEDVLQEAALAAFEKLDRFQPDTSFLGWMGSFVRNHARNQARKNQRRATRPLGARALESLGSEVDKRNGRRVRLPEEELIGRTVLESRGELSADLEAFDDDLLAALSSLPEEARAALLLRIVNDLTYREVGQALGIPEGTAASHVHRARNQLRDLLEAKPDQSDQSDQGLPIQRRRTP